MPVRFKGGGGGGTVVVGGSAVWQPIQKAAIKLSLTLRTLSTVKPAIKLSQAPSKLVSTLKSAVKLSSFISGTVTPAQKTAVKMSSLLAQKTPPSILDATKLSYFLNLNGIYGGASQSNTGWTNGANALGKHDSANATVASSLTAATGGALTMPYATLPNKTNLTITNVTLDLYGSQAGTILANGNYKFEYSINGGSSWTTVFTNTGNFTNSLGTDITSVIAGNWANLQSFQVRVTAAYAAAVVGVTAALDAVELKVTANLPITTP